MMRRRRGVGLLGTAAIAGTAAYAGNRMAKSAAEDDMRDQQIADLQAQVAAQQAPPPPPQAAPAPPPPAPAAAAPSMDDKIAQLQQLAELKTAGVLTDAEFEAQKAKILAG